MKLTRLTRRTSGPSCAGVAIAFALIATLLASPHTALAAPAMPGGATATRQAEPKSEDALPDLTVRLLRREGGALEPGELFSLETVVTNEGRGPGKPVRVQIFLAASFEAVRVIDAPGFSCTSVLGQFECRGGQVPAGQNVRIVVEARASQTPGDFKSVVFVDRQEAVDESDESNNFSILPLNVRNRD
jgi:hypothetical protein